jgi:hypothetical protein
MISAFRNLQEPRRRKALAGSYAPALWTLTPCVFLPAPASRAFTGLTRPSWRLFGTGTLSGAARKPPERSTDREADEEIDQ